MNNTADKYYTDNQRTSSKKSADPLPYIITFAVLFLVALAVLTWTLDIWSKAHECGLDPNIWCSDNWRCNSNCLPTDPYSSCFLNGTNASGLASCLYGPNAFGATACFVSPIEGTGLSCECPIEMNNARSCFSQCARNFGDIGRNSSCCCCPGTDDCPWKSPSEVPAECAYVQGQSCST